MKHVRIQPLATDVIRPDPFNPIEVLISAVNAVGSILESFVSGMRKVGLLDTADDYQMRRWIKSLPSLAYMDDTNAYLIIFDKEFPSKSKVITEVL